MDDDTFTEAEIVAFLVMKAAEAMTVEEFSAEFHALLDDD